MSERYFDDFSIGDRFKTRGATLTEAQIIDFAYTYDPQPFHIDKVAAAEGPYGGLIASGFQTLAFSFRLFLAENIIAACSLGSPGMDHLRWLKPVRPGDTLHIEAEVKEMRPSQSKSDRGVLHMYYAVKNQNDEVVMSYIATHMLRRQTT